MIFRVRTERHTTDAGGLLGLSEKPPEHESTTSARQETGDCRPFGPSFCLTAVNRSSNPTRGAGFAKFELARNKLTAWRKQLRKASLFRELRIHQSILAANSEASSPLLVQFAPFSHLSQVHAARMLTALFF